MLWKGWALAQCLCIASQIPATTTISNSISSTSTAFHPPSNLTALSPLSPASYDRLHITISYHDSGPPYLHRYAWSHNLFTASNDLLRQRSGDDLFEGYSHTEDGITVSLTLLSLSTPGFINWDAAFVMRYTWQKVNHRQQREVGTGGEGRGFSGLGIRVGDEVLGGWVAVGGVRRVSHP